MNPFIPLLLSLLFPVSIHARPQTEQQGFPGHPVLRHHFQSVQAPRRIGRALFSDHHPATSHPAGIFESLRSEEHLSHHSHIFATILCTDDMEPGVTILHEGLLLNGHREPLVVVTAVSVSARVRARLALLPLVKLLRSQEGFAGYCGSEGEMHDCAHLKLLMFGLGQVHKIVFLEYDTVVLRNLERLVRLPAFSAVREAHVGWFETSMMVIVPDRQVYEVLRESFCGGERSDHEVIRTVVPDEVWTEADDTFNVPQEHMDALWYRKVDLRPAVVHFKGTVKPWNWWRGGMGEPLSVAAFRLWCEVAKETEFRCGGAEGEEMVGSLQPNSWSDKKRFTVLLSTCHRSMWQGLVRHYTSFKMVNQVVLVWHDPFGDPPLAASLGLKVVVWQPRVDSLNNRFFAPGNLTECVYVADDDMKVNEEQLKRGFQIWRGHTRRLVGYFPRRWMMESPYYSAKVHDGYNVVLTKGLFTHRYFLYLYVHLLPKRIQDVVDRYGNCEDILFNMMVSGYNGVAPLHVLVEGRILDLGHGGGISARGAHFSTRFECTKELIRELGLRKAPLSIGSYSEKPVKNKERE